MCAELNEADSHLLEALLTGELDPASPEAHAALERSAALRAVFDEHQRLREALKENRTVIAEARESTTDSDRELVRASMKEAGLALPGAPRSSRRDPAPWAWWRRPRGLWAAATILIATALTLYLTWGGDDRGRPDDGVLGRDGILLHPVGEVSAFTPVRVDYEAIGPHRRVVIRILDPESGETLAEVERFADETWQEWNPEEPEQAALDGMGAIRVVVEVYDLNNLVGELIRRDSTVPGQNPPPPPATRQEPDRGW